jgi:hypothetical protein
MKLTVMSSLNEDKNNLINVTQTSKRPMFFEWEIFISVFKILEENLTIFAILIGIKLFTQLKKDKPPF